MRAIVTDKDHGVRTLARVEIARGFDRGRADDRELDRDESPRTHPPVPTDLKHSHFKPVLRESLSLLQEKRQRPRPAQ